MDFFADPADAATAAPPDLVEEHLRRMLCASADAERARFLRLFWGSVYAAALFLLLLWRYFPAGRKKAPKQGATQLQHFQEEEEEEAAGGRAHFGGTTGASRAPLATPSPLVPPRFAPRKWKLPTLLDPLTLAPA